MCGEDGVATSNLDNLISNVGHLFDFDGVSLILTMDDLFDLV